MVADTARLPLLRRAEHPGFWVSFGVVVLIVAVAPVFFPNSFWQRLLTEGRITQSSFGMVLQAIRENEERARAIGYRIEYHKMITVMLSALCAGLAGALYGIFNAYAAPDYFFFFQSGETVIYNVMGGIGTLVGPIVGAGVFVLLKELFSTFWSPGYYLIPVGLLFTLMVMFMPQGLLGFLRHRLNR